MHTKGQSLSANPWEQWQAIAARFAAPISPSSAAPLMDSAERFMDAARAFLSHAATPSSSAGADNARVFSDSVRDMFADFPQPWNFGFGAHPVNNGAAAAAASGSPALGAAREQQQRWQRIVETWRRIEDAQRRLQRLWSDTMREAAAAFAVELGKLPTSAATAQDLHKIYDTWIDCAEEAYSRTAHSEAFCDTLAEYANASSQWRNEIQASVEHSAKQLDLPTRSEINTLTLRVQSLEAQLRAMRSTPEAKSQVPPKTRRARRKTNP
jgi:polyhydroxyalkanoate synthesis regulator phasin